MAALGLGAIGLAHAASDEGDPWSSFDGFRINGAARLSQAFAVGEEAVVVQVETDGEGRSRLSSGAASRDVLLEIAEGEDGVAVTALGKAGPQTAEVRRLSSGAVAFVDGRAWRLDPPVYGQSLEGAAAGDEIRAPMPGKILDVKVAVGDSVKKGQALVVLEAMKMEHSLSAPRDGEIAEIAAAKGQQTVEGAMLVRLVALPET